MSVLQKLKNFSFWGKGLLQGLQITGKVLFRKKLTEDYPFVKAPMPDAWRGGFAFDKDKCIACGICVMECPNEAIWYAREKDENNKNKITGYKINLGHCLSCGLCVEACPASCLFFTTEYEAASYRKEDSILDLLKNPNLEAPRSTYGQKLQPVAKAVAPVMEKPPASLQVQPQENAGLPAPAPQAPKEGGGSGL